ncbi:MAG: hypothetical protein M1360_01940 [Candidatus Marsarchaeota archaeon]|jgi:hypothetical protein|nr:hypothetical protein [Candidatus Marsarchaeota archaeon]MCL5418682.1 hypothetical protein [Candidatus Marsarchaeota archaeon]
MPINYLRVKTGEGSNEGSECRDSSQMLRKEKLKDNLTAIFGTSAFTIPAPFLALYAAKGDIVGALAALSIIVAGTVTFVIRPKAFVIKTYNVSTKE